MTRNGGVCFNTELIYQIWILYSVGNLPCWFELRVLRALRVKIVPVALSTGKV